MKAFGFYCSISLLILMQACSSSAPLPAPAPTQTLVPYKFVPPTPTLVPITPTATSVPSLGPMPPDATGSDMVMMQYTKPGTNGDTLLFSQELGMWMELHSPTEGIFLIDRRIAFYETSRDLIPLIVEADPALDWKDNLIRSDQTKLYTTDRLRLVSFPSALEIELALQSGIDLHQKNTYQDVTALMEDIYQGVQYIQFGVPDDSQEYTWNLSKGVRVWLVKDGFFDSKTDPSVYALDNGDRIKFFARDGVLEYIISTNSLGQPSKKGSLLTKILSPMFDVILAINGELPLSISGYYDPTGKKKSAGDLADLAGPVIVKDMSSPGFIMLVGR